MFAHRIVRALRDLLDRRRVVSTPIADTPYTCPRCRFEWQTGDPGVCLNCGHRSGQPAGPVDVYAGAIQLRASAQAADLSPAHRSPAPVEPGPL